MSYADEVLADSPLGYWKLDETGGSTATDAATGHDGTYFGSYTLNQTKVRPTSTGGAVDLVPTTQGCITIADHADFDIANGAWTIEAWLLMDTAAADPGRCIFTFGSGGPIVRLTNTPTPNIQVIRSHQAFITDNGGAGWDPPVGSACYIAVTYAGSNGNFIFYLDAETPYDAGAVTANFVSNADTKLIGYDTDEAEFDGRISDVAVYGAALSAARISAHYTAGTTAESGPSPADLFVVQNRRVRIR